MKRLALCVCLLFVAGMVATSLSSLLAEGKSHPVNGEVVSVDLQGKTLTVKNEKGENMTAPVMGKALDSLKTLKVGDKVILTCLDNEKGEHQGITAIKVATEPGK